MRLPARTALALTLVGAPLSCAADYSEEPPPSLAEYPLIDTDDELIFERELRWWSRPFAQQVQLWQREDGSLLLLRERWDGLTVYAWATAELTDAGGQRLADALAAVDRSRPQPAPGNFECSYRETLPAIVYVDDQAFEYLSTCPPEGLSELATFYEQLVELLLACPFDASWYPDELPLTPIDCEVAG